MPWKETDVVNLRNEFVMRAFEDKIPFIALCQEYGISPKTGYKWKERFLSNGMFGLSYNTPTFSDQCLRWYCCGMMVSGRSSHGTAETVWRRV